MATRRTRYVLANGEIWKPNPTSGQRWICLNCDDYAAIHGDATIAVRRQRRRRAVRRQGGVRIRFDPPVGRARARRAGYVARPCPFCGRASRTSRHKASLIRRLPKDAPGRRERSRSGGRR